MLLLQLAAAADTVLVRQVSPVRTGFEQLVFVASGLTSVLTLLLVLAVLLALVGMRQTAIALQAKLDEVLGELRPMTQNVNATSADVREAAAAAKAMVLESRETVAMANARVRVTVDDLADRVDELSEILAKITRVATRVAGIAGTAIGGIKAGARVFGIGRKSKKKQRAVDADVESRPRLRRRR
ncbi:MAG: hypothetical protein KF689_07145 [Gemmatimonadaceae bacterium]|nr:hypothetical protein [Gemmatimonadaceae bacterium]MCW5825054.1 hypothetical protein [Gemmatimonadaceae bacterium]